MAFNLDREDHSSVISEEEIRNAKTDEDKLELVKKILNSLNEKRDAYNGIIVSIIYILKTNDLLMIDSLRDGLIAAITAQPMKHSRKMFITKVQTRLMKEMPIFVEDLFEQIILKPHESLDSDDLLRIKIIALRAIRISEQHPKARPTIVPQQVIEKLCEAAVYGRNDETKVDTISLLLECKSTTKPLEQRELNLFKVVYQDALSVSEPSLRQILLSVTNKLIKRIKESYKAVVRYTKIYTEEQRVQVYHRYIEFLQWLIEFSFDSIYCNAYFGSFILTINTLKYIIQHITYTDSDLPILQFLNKKHCYESLLTCINDSFEQNKTLSLELILMLPYNDKFINERNLESFKKIAYQLVDSINPAHSLSCIYMFKLLIGLNSRIDEVKLTKNQLLLHHLTLLADQIEASVVETRTNFVSALNHKPIHSKLGCIRALLSDVEMKMIKEDKAGWEDLTRKMVTCSINACDAVSTVVCNLNPETIGHLPMDLKPLDASSLSKTLNVNVEISRDNIETISSQMLLITGWKTIKESSLSLGTICQRFWWPKKKNDSFSNLQPEPILSYDLVIIIINFFEHYLRNLRHRGAFEQAYYGFMMVTQQIWQDERFRTPLVQILERIMSDFKTEALDEKKVECLKAYVTRRSAGLPFIIQAILNSEHKHDSKMLRWVTCNLFEVLESRTAEEYQRIHCLNILRALIKEHHLGEKVASFIGKTFIVTLESFRSESFPVRNCASMLLKAVMDRTFGVNRLRDDIHRHNQLSFTKFFENCPNLHQLMLQLLNDSIKDDRSLATIHAIFIILFRLRSCVIPELKEANEALIEPFLVPVKELALNCKDYKLRELASKLLIRLLGFSAHPEVLSHSFLDAIVDILFSTSEAKETLTIKTDKNHLHGLLLLAKYQTECFSMNDEKYCKKIELIIKEICAREILPSSIKVAAMDLVETYCINNPEQGKYLAYQLYSPITKWLSDDQVLEPMYENLVFRAVITYLMAIFKNKHLTSDFQITLERDVDCLMNLLMELIMKQPNNIFSINLQASLIRFFRQVLNSSETFVDHLMDNLDLDSTAALITPFDRLNQKLENDAEREKLANYCTLNHLLTDSLIRNIFTKSSGGELFKLSKYREFALEEGSQLSLKNRNTPRAIELMAFICKSFAIIHNLGVDCIKFRDLIRFINRLPECDLKCLMVLHGGQLLSNGCGLLTLDFIEEEDEFENEGQKSRDRVIDVLSMEEYCSMLDELADGCHCTNIRETCTEVLKTLKIMLSAENYSKKCSKSLLSALIKLSQDEEHSIRKSSLNIMTSLQALMPKSNLDKPSDGYTVVSPLDNLIKLITCQLLNPNTEKDLNDCFELMMKVIFNHSKNYSNDLNEEKEQLFDKTKLNTFSDHVTTIQTTLKGLKTFFINRLDENGQVKLVNLNDLEISEHVRQELSVVDSVSIDETGDYSWRLKKIKEHTEKQLLTEEQATDNNQLVDKAIECILVSMDYFSNKYWNMLIDTDYTYHELSLFKRIVFLKFVIECTDHNLKNEHLVSRIRESLFDLTEESSCTTLLKKCLNLMV